MEQLLALEMIRVTEAAAIESARFMGRGEKDAADAAATEAMRSTMDEIDFAGRIVIGAVSYTHLTLPTSDLV